MFSGASTSTPSPGKALLDADKWSVATSHLMPPSELADQWSVADCDDGVNTLVGMGRASSSSSSSSSATGTAFAGTDYLKRK